MVGLQNRKWWRGLNTAGWWFETGDRALMSEVTEVDDPHLAVQLVRKRARPTGDAWPLPPRERATTRTSVPISTNVDKYASVAFIS